MSSRWSRACSNSEMVRRSDQRRGYSWEPAPRLMWTSSASTSSRWSRACSSDESLSWGSHQLTTQRTGGGCGWASAASIGAEGGVCADGIGTPAAGQGTSCLHARGTIDMNSFPCQALMRAGQSLNGTSFSMFMRCCLVTNTDASLASSSLRRLSRFDHCRCSSQERRAGWLPPHCCTPGLVCARHKKKCLLKRRLRHCIR